MRYLITSALPYINGIKHLGNLVGSMLPADVHARYLRLRGHDVLYVCATDEHGTPAELAATEAGMSVEEYCQAQHQLQADVYARFQLSFDFFGRTSKPSNHELTRALYEDLKAAGFIEKRQIRQLYSLDDGRYLPDRYVLGTCPHCGFNAARGDQCENCTRLLDPVDLLSPRSAISGSTNIEPRDTLHLYLQLSKLAPEVSAWVETHLQGPPLVQSIARKWLTEGLRDRCITRDLRWGVAVPEPDMDGKVFYVWFDAPIGYIATTKDWADASANSEGWQRYWLDAKDVTYVQYMAKDNVPFHTIMFPAMLLGSRKPWKMPDYIKGFNWLNYYGGKFSTSSKRGVFLDVAIDLFAADYWRYSLLAMSPESADSTFTWNEFATYVNKDLNDNLGNFVNRVLRFGASHFGPVVPSGGDPGEAEKLLEQQCSAAVERVKESLAAMEFRKATEALRDLWSVGNSYVDRAAPWSAIKANREQGAMIVRTCMNVIALYSFIMEPFIPATASTLRNGLHLGSEVDANTIWERPRLDLLTAGNTIDTLPPLFRKIDAAQVAELEARFQGTT
jgi:methionyl-tRNA synthetase